MVTPLVEFPPFRYMRWAKGSATAPPVMPRYNLAKSGLAPPPESLLPVNVAAARNQLDLVQRAADMPAAERQRLADRYRLPADRLALTLGTSHAMFLAMRVLLGPGQRAMVETPTYEVLANLPRVVGGETQTFSRRMQDGFRLPEELPARILADKPRVVVLSNPHNPSGALLSLDEMRPVAEAAAEAGANLLVDEVYLEFLDEPAQHSAIHLGDHVVVASSFTKAFGLGAVRFGWLVGEAEMIAHALAFNDYLGVLYPNPSAWIGGLALDRQAPLRARAQNTRKLGLAVLRDWVRSRTDVHWHPSEAGVMALLQLPQVRDVASFCQQLLNERGTLVVPGGFFGAPDCIRIGVTAPAEELRDGLTELGAHLDADAPVIR